MSVYQMASMLVGQLALVLQHDPKQDRGTIKILPKGDEAGVFIHPKDAEY